MKTSRFKIPQCETKSAFDKNFKARANSINPITIFVVFNHVPDFGIEFSAFGNKEKRPKGKDKANPNPNIPIVNWVAPPLDDSDPASKEPKIGPVHENDTIARVKAIKNKPKIPLIFVEAESEKFDQLYGSFNS